MTTIHQKIEYKEKEVKILQYILKKICQIKERRNIKKEEKSIAYIEKQFKDF